VPPCAPLPASRFASKHVLYSVQTGKPGFDKAWGTGPFDYFTSHPDLAKDLSDTMVAFHGNETPAVAAAYDFSGIGTVVDVGGATGNLLAAILERHPHVQGILFDLPHVVRDAGPLLERKRVAQRIQIRAGNFFQAIPQGGDAYILSHVIHDWDESAA
jgi:O-methyltransferase domain